ncbi:MAG: sulfurtransferase TusA family protein [Mariprofundaceae bacterium]|nr:sulfurtransferase TusA family protein [Mariprofundaceae bacterium]
MSTFEFAQAADVDEFEAGYQAFKAGRMPEERFTPFRLQMGVYGQRQEGVQMIRAKLPGGNITPEQLIVLGDLAERYGGCMPTDGTLKVAPEKVIHITTRQDIQVNFVALDDVVPFLRQLDKAGITTREACGNTVRNVTTCFLAGRCPAEHADVSIHARQFAEYFLRHPLAQQFPRKFKVNFSGCDTDCGLGGMHDIGFIATHHDGVAGFKVWAAGGLSSQPVQAILLEEFIPESDIFLVGEALMRIHFKFSDRKRRARARMKYVMQKLGAEGFVEEYKKQRAVIESTHKDDATYAEANWRTPTGVMPFDESGIVDQHNGKKSILLNVFRGDLTAIQCRAVAEAARLGKTNALRVTTEQGLVMVDVDESYVDDVVEMLGNAAIPTAYARAISDITACPGTETCRLGITSSRGLAAALQPLLSDLKHDSTLAGITVKASGCQHSCGRHHIADLGFHGMAKKVAGQAVPHYQLHVGGSGVAGQPFAFASEWVPAKHAPEAGMAVLRAYQGGREADESVHDWAERLGKEGLSDILAPYQADAGEVEGLIYDWNENEVFNTKGNKKGECAGAVLSMSDALISEAEYELLLARAHVDAMFWAEAQAALRRSAISTARAFLVAYGEAPEDDAEVFAKLMQNAATDTEVFTGVMAVQNALMSIDLAEPAAGVMKLKDVQGAWLALAEKRFAAVPDAIQVANNVESNDAGHDEDTVSDLVSLDLSGVACPMNFVKTKIKLSSMAIGSQLEVILDDGAPIDNVPLSLEEQGQKVHVKEKIADTQWRIVVEKISHI